MYENLTHPLLAQVPLMVSQSISLPVATTLPSTYKKLPSTLPPSSIGPIIGQSENKYVISTSGHAAHPDEILASCEALMVYVQKVTDDANEELKTWEADIIARELAEKRRVAPGWLDSDARILNPEKSKHSLGTLIDSQVNESVLNVSTLRVMSPVTSSREGDELDRAFGGLEIENK